MYSKLKPFSFNSESMFLSEKDLGGFFVRSPPSEADHCCQIAPTFQDIDESSQQQRKEERSVQDQDQQQQEEKLCSKLQINLPSSGEFDAHNESNSGDREDGKNDVDGFKTPTSSDHKIPAMLKCPPAPRKPKSLLSPKRKAAFRRKILLDLTKEIECLFPPALVADLGNKIKKVRQGSDFS